MTRLRRARPATLLAALLALVLSGLLSAAPAGAETAAGFYKGKVVKLVVGYGAGGGYDLYARMLAPHLERRLGATVVVENRPGGGGIVALNQVAAARPDGLTLMLISAASSTFSQIVQAEGVRYDMARLGFLGRVIDEKRALVIGTRSGIESIEDLRNAGRPIAFGAISRNDTVAATACFLAEALGLDARLVAGYKGSKEVALAALRGEVDGFAVSDSSARSYNRNEGLFAFMVLSRERSSQVPDVPTVFELVGSLEPEQAWWVDYADALLGLGRALVTTPDLPAERLQYLQEVVKAVLTDPAVLAEAEATQRPLDYASPQEARRMVDTVVGSLSEEQLRRVRHVVQDKY